MIGLQLSRTIKVSEQLTAKRVGSGDMEVYATPMMVALMENTAARLIAQFIDEEQTTVGTGIDITHSSPTPVGMNVTATATITQVDPKRITFEVTAEDDCGLIGKGLHTRVIVDKRSFQKKADKKLEQ